MEFLSKMAKVLIVGSGGREHALGWKLGQSRDVSIVYYAPGNAGTESQKGRNIHIDGSKKENFENLQKFVAEERIDIVVVGPEAPLADGIADYFAGKGYTRVFGPQKKASLLESDKFYSYDIMEKLGIPQASSVKCSDFYQAQKAVQDRITKDGIVIKARGLTGGKGVAVCNSADVALREAEAYIKHYGSDILIAERLFGQEFSVFGISDGKNVSPLEIAVQDHKPLLDSDKGPNTGGMGSYCPVQIAPKQVVIDVAEKIMTPIVQEMQSQGVEYRGFLYAGMMMTNHGPKVLEFNVRFGDPECQPAMMMLDSDLYEILSLALEGNIKQINPEFNPGAACCVVLASQGYPVDYKNKIGIPIFGLGPVEEISQFISGNNQTGYNIKVFHSGTAIKGNDIVINGGRVLGVTAYSSGGLKKARDLAYKFAEEISGKTGKDIFHYRKDIGIKGLL